MKKYEITEEQAQAIINYLASCQYAQVFQLIAMMQNLKEINEKKDGI
jgi:hypothetical protein